MPIAPKRLKLRTSNLTHMFPGTVRIWHPIFFPKRGVFKNLLGGDMHSHERLLVIISYFIEACTLNWSRIHGRRYQRNCSWAILKHLEKRAKLKTWKWSLVSPWCPHFSSKLWKSARCCNFIILEYTDLLHGCAWESIYNRLLLLNQQLVLNSLRF